MAGKRPSGGVSIGNVTGGTHGSIIAGRDVKNATITLGGQPTLADQQPSLDQFKQLLAEIQKELAEITAQKDALKQVSSATPFTAQGAEQSVKDAAEQVAPEMKPEAAQSVQKSLAEATSLLGGILDGAKSVAEKATEVGRAVKPIAEKLEPLVEKLGVAALWAARLWLLK
jgi:phage-related tail protein